MKVTFTDRFIKQTSKDYDIPFDVVSKIMKRHPKKFYSELEKYIENRAKKNNN